MRRFVIIFTISVAIITTFSISLAADTPSPVDRLRNTGVAAGYSESVNETSVATTVGQIIKTFLSLLGIIFMAYVVYAGFLWMTASGEEEKLRKAKAIIRGSVIGLIVALSGYVITITVVDRLNEATGYGSALLTLTRWV